MTIFLVEEDDHARPILSKELRQLGYRLLVTAALEDAREWVRGNGHIQADLMLINLVGKTPEEALIVGRELREQARYNEQTPLVVIPEKVADEMRGTNVNLSGNDWICHFDDSSQLQALLGHLTSKSHCK